MRSDLGMGPGKLASQAGHAYLGAFLAAQSSSWIHAAPYSSKSPGTKVCLRGSGQQLMRAEAELCSAGIPCYRVIDSGCPDFFDGKPILTALGFGPATKEQVHHITKRFNLL